MASHPVGLSIRDLLIERSCPDPNTGCWLWMRATDSYGYGLIKIKGKLQKAHRVSLANYLGMSELPYTCHRCDTPACVNPAHLFVGSHLVNMADKTAKRRAPHGDGHSRRKLSSDQVIEMRALRMAGATQVSLAARFDISRRNVRHILAGNGWRYI